MIRDALITGGFLAFACVLVRGVVALIADAAAVCRTLIRARQP